MSDMLPDVVVERLIRATPERIFRALTDAREIEQWFFSTAKTDPQPGGSYNIRWESLKNPQHNHTRSGNYLEFVPGQKLVFEWRGIGPEEPEGHANEPTDTTPTIVTVTLKPVEGGTLVRLIHSGWGEGKEWKQSRDGHEEGWAFYLENLDSVLFLGKDLRKEEGNQKIK